MTFFFFMQYDGLRSYILQEMIDGMDDDQIKTVQNLITLDPVKFLDLNEHAHYLT